MSSPLKSLKAINNSIIFTFVEAVSGGMFRTSTKSGLQIIENADKQLKAPRWGKVVKVGPKVSSDVKEDMYILVEPLMWTTHLEYEGVKFWVTNEDKVFAVSDDAPA